MKKLIICFILCGLYLSLAAELYFQQSLAASLDSDLKFSAVELGLNYKPKLQYQYDFSANYFSDLYYEHHLLLRGGSQEIKLSQEIYRAWLRLAGDFLTIRLGRQKINFGTARFLRTLRWFDTINPLDPKAESSGVDALLLRYYFADNQNIWLWLVQGKQGSLKGNEQLPSAENLEPGLRWQMVLGNAEIALAAHHRQRLDLQHETKLAGDFRCDYFLGFWGEFQYLFTTEATQQQFTLGSDYTLPIFNGWHIMLEQQLFSNSQIPNLTALSLDFPLSLFDSFTLAYLRSSQSQNLSLQYQRSYDQLFWYILLGRQEQNSVFENNISLNLSYHF